MKTELEKRKQAEYMRRYLAKRAVNDPEWAEELKKKKREYYAKRKASEPGFMERRREKGKRWRSSDSGREAQREYTKRNREHINALGRARYHRLKNDPEFKRKQRARENRYAQSDHGRAKINARFRALRKTERGRRMFLKYDLKKNYGLTIEQYESMLTSQGGVCAICKKLKFGKQHPRLTVDHDHKTGKVRGLLCWFCNKAIGLLSDDPSLCIVAAEYLRKETSNG